MVNSTRMQKTGGDMTKFGTLVSIGAAALLSAVVFCAHAQDDLDDLLKDLYYWQCCL